MAVSSDLVFEVRAQNLFPDDMKFDLVSQPGTVTSFEAPGH